jgi:high-affinity Fe2+/Pb2+ permease
MTEADVLQKEEAAEEVQSRVEEIRRLEADIKKELGMLQLRMKMDAKNGQNSSGNRKNDKLHRMTSLGFREHVTLFFVVFVLLFAVSPVFRGLVVAAYKHYVLGVGLAEALGGNMSSN